MADEGNVKYLQQGGASASGSPPSDGDHYLRIMDARLEASEHRLMRTIDHYKADLRTLVDARASRGDVWGGVAVVVATVLTAIGLWVAAFDSGAQLQGSVADTLRQTQNLAEENSRVVETILANEQSRDERFSTILERLELIAEVQSSGSAEAGAQSEQSE